jgi:hypothetical protein
MKDDNDGRGNGERVGMENKKIVVMITDRDRKKKKVEIMNKARILAELVRKAVTS